MFPRRSVPAAFRRRPANGMPSAFRLPFAASHASTLARLCSPGPNGRTPKAIGRCRFARLIGHVPSMAYAFAMKHRPESSRAKHARTTVRAKTRRNQLSRLQRHCHRRHRCVSMLERPILSYGRKRLMVWPRILVVGKVRESFIAAEASTTSGCICRYVFCVK